MGTVYVCLIPRGDSGIPRVPRGLCKGSQARRSRGIWLSWLRATWNGPRNTRRRWAPMRKTSWWGPGGKGLVVVSIQSRWLLPLVRRGDAQSPAGQVIRATKISIPTTCRLSCRKRQQTGSDKDIENTSRRSSRKKLTSANCWIPLARIFP